MKSGHVFATSNPALERSLSVATGTTVLAAREVSAGTICVVERVKNGVYAVTKLAPDVGEGDVLVAAKSRLHRETKSEVQAKGSDWREAARVDPPPAVDVVGLGRLSKFDVKVVFGCEKQSDETEEEDARAEGQSPGDAAQESSNGVLQTPPEAADEQERGAEAENAVVDRESLLDGLKTQYLEALYISKVYFSLSSIVLLMLLTTIKTSLAYFAKGPLTRCRRAFESEDGSNPRELAAFYRNMILPVKKMDLKYKETLPSKVNDVALVLSEDDSRSKKRKSKKKNKLGKNGLYPEEDDFIRKWWKARHNVDSTGARKEDDAKRYISDLRLRETQLQILLILETIYLEGIAGSDGAANPADDGSSSQSKKKKQPELNVLLELLVDRLCIWHAVTDDPVVTDTGRDSAGSQDPKGTERDMLRDYCTEVIIPFYASRLPEQCKSIKKKLGGPTDTSPTRPPPQPKPSASKPPPGAAVKRPQQQQQPNKSRRTLQRVLTEEKEAATKRKHPSLVRSSTAPSAHDLKRGESREPSLPPLHGSVRGGIQVPRRVEAREVDLEAAAKQQEARLKKINAMMAQKKELEAAIEALRKPNRELFAREMADSAAKRVSGNTSAKKGKNPMRNASSQGVQVMATPKGSRTRDVPEGPARRESPSLKRPGPVHGTSPNNDGEVDMVPASTVRQRALQDMRRRGDFTTVQDTPSRGSADRAAIEDTPLEPRRQASPTMAPVPDTPVKGKTTTSGESIYQQLGWDDEDDELI